MLNVKTSDVVFCIIDQRYGPPLPNGDYKGLSATHAEVRYARKQGIDVRFFIRREAFMEWSTLKREPDSRTHLVEPSNHDNKKRWADFVSEYAHLPSERGVSNWFDQFDTVFDLKQIAEARVRAIRAMR